MAWRTRDARVRFLVVAACASGAAAPGSFGACGGGQGGAPAGGLVEVLDIVISPEVLRTNQTLHVRVPGRLPGAAGDGTVDATAFTVHYSVLYCRRAEDCMAVFEQERPLSEFLSGLCEGADCARVPAGSEFVSVTSWKLPLKMVRGTYTLLVELEGPGGAFAGCYMLEYQQVLATLFGNKLRDLRDALVAFAIAASASKQLGGYFPVLSRGALPQITGFLLMGVLVGPYCSNLVSHMHIYLIGNALNCVSLAFIAGAAGAEIFLPELQSLLAPMALQVLLICSATVLFCVPGLLLVTGYGLVDVPSISEQSSLGARAALAFLAAALMTARSPASAIAVISELQCGESVAAKMAIGITVLSDVAVLVLFSVAKQIVRVALEGEGLGFEAAGSVAAELLLSSLVGLLLGQALRLVLPAERAGGGAPEAGGAGPAAPMLSAEGSPLAERGKKSTEENAFERQLAGGQDGGTRFEDVFTRSLALQGVVVLAILSSVFPLASFSKHYLGEWARMEPLMTCTFASCWCGHDTARRPQLLGALSLWTPVVLLPFFTLAGASLELPMLRQVLPAALTLVVLRTAANAAGSVAAGLLTRRAFPWARPSGASVRCTWCTLLAQAGVTLGLVLEIQRTFPEWSRPFATLIIGVVVLNQLQGPVLCRLGLQRILREEGASSGSGSSSESEESS